MAAGLSPAALKVTVVMPVRNEGRNVAKTLESLEAQTRRPDEVLIVDGCSTDDTLDQIARYAERGLALRVLRNERRFRGPALNLGTAEAGHEIVVPMDFGNLARPTWLEELARPFAKDPDLDLVGGLHEPMMGSRFERVSAAVIYYEDCLVSTYDEATLRSLLPPDFVAGGMCMAYRRSAWERAGGFCEWAQRGQDRLFGLRIRHLGGKVGLSLGAVVEHEMAQSFAEIFARHYRYGLWVARTGLPRRRFARLSKVYAGGLALLLLTPAAPWLLLPLAALLGGYVHIGAFRKLVKIGEVRALRFSLADHALAVAVLFARDAAVIAGNLRGSFDRLTGQAWRRRTRAYIERGEQDEAALPAFARVRPA